MSLLVEETYYLRREEEHSPLPQPAKRHVDCLLCDQSDSTAPRNKRKNINRGKRYSLDRLMAYLKSAHKDELIDDGSRTLDSLAG